MGVNGVWRRCYAKDNAVHRLHRGFVQTENEPSFMGKKNYYMKMQMQRERRLPLTVGLWVLWAAEAGRIPRVNFAWQMAILRPVVRRDDGSQWKKKVSFNRCCCNVGLLLPGILAGRHLCAPMCTRTQVRVVHTHTHTHPHTCTYAHIMHTHTGQTNYIRICYTLTQYYTNVYNTEATKHTGL